MFEHILNAWPSVRRSVIMVISECVQWVQRGYMSRSIGSMVSSTNNKSHADSEESSRVRRRFMKVEIKNVNNLRFFQKENQFEVLWNSKELEKSFGCISDHLSSSSGRSPRVMRLFTPITVTIVDIENVWTRNSFDSKLSMHLKVVNDF